MSDDGPGARTLRFDGVVDFLSAPTMQEKALGLLTEPDITHLVVDMTGLTFIDSSGLSLLVYLKGRCDERGIDIALRAVPPRARGLIDSLGLSAYFDLPPH